MPKPAPLLKPLIPLESDIQSAILRYLEADPRVVFAARINSGAKKGEGGNFVRFYTLHKVRALAAERGRADIIKALTRFTKTGRAMINDPSSGLSDIVGLLADGRMLAIEVKRPDWRKPKDDRERLQEFILQMVSEHGGVSGFARSLDDVRGILSGSCTRVNPANSVGSR